MLLALPGSARVVVGAPMVVVGALMVVVGVPMVLIGAPSYSTGRLQCPPRVEYSFDIDPSIFTLHILPDTAGGSQ